MPIANLIELPRSLKTEQIRRKPPQPQVIYLQVGDAVLRQRGDRFYMLSPRRSTLRKLPGGRWVTSFFDTNGKYRRITIQAEDLTQAIAITLDGCSGGAITSPKVNPGTFNVADMFSRWDESLTVKDWTRRRYRQEVVRFLAWCESKRIELVSQIERPLILEYLSMLKHDKGLSRVSRVHAFAPIRGMLRWANECYPEIRNTAEGIKIRGDGERKQRPSPLSLEQAVELCEDLKRQKDPLLCGVALQLFAAARVLEVMRLSWEDIDFTEGTLSIWGEVKNDSSLRKVPLCDYLLAILKASRGTGPIVKGMEWQSYAKAVHRRLCDFYRSDVTAMYLRKTLETSSLLLGGINLELLNLFCGRAPGSVQAKHYMVCTPAQLVEAFRTQIIEPLNAQISEILQIGDGSPKF